MTEAQKRQYLKELAEETKQTLIKMGWIECHKNYMT